jgi:hypothetical protein
MPFASCDPRPTRANPVREVWVDPELGSEGFTYRLASGAEGSVHADHVFHANRDPAYLAKLLLYELTSRAREQFEQSSMTIRELAQRLDSTPVRVRRLLDTTNYRKSIRQMLAVLQALDCSVEIHVRPRNAA